VVSLAAYGGYSFAHWLSTPADTGKKVAKKVVGAKKTVVKAEQTTTTTEPIYILRYKVKSGDTLYGIAQINKTTVGKIKELNDIKRDDLSVGVTLKVPTKVKPPDVDPNQGKEATATATAVKLQKSVASMKASAQEIYRGPMDAKKIALTFDAGAASESTPRILDVLKQENVKATFFLTGKWVNDNPRLTKRIAGDGHIIGNHTYSHPDLAKMTDKQISDQLQSTDDLINQTVGFSSKPLFRFPYGSRDTRVLNAVAKAGYRSIYWTTDSLDWKPDMTPEKVKERVLGSLGNGAIILVHCGSEKTAEILPDLIRQIKGRGYSLATIPELLN
jgi:delta-lactam-biosynthetic de-N-acetylase